MKGVAMVILCAGFTAVASSAYATSINLQFNSLPSAQGWTYQSGLAGAEGTVYSVDGTGLFLDTIGMGTVEPSYLMPNTVDTTDPFVFSTRARVSDTEGAPNSFSLFFDVRTSVPNEEAIFGVSTTDVYDDVGHSFALDGTAFHTYTLAGTPDGPFSLYVDGSLAFTSAFATLGGAVNGVEFGDNGGAPNDNVNAEITCLSFSQPGGSLTPCAGATAVPEPGSLLLVATGSFLVRRRLARRGVARQSDASPRVTEG